MTGKHSLTAAGQEGGGRPERGEKRHFRGSEGVKLAVRSGEGTGRSRRHRRPRLPLSAPPSYPPPSAPRRDWINNMPISLYRALIGHSPLNPAPSLKTMQTFPLTATSALNHAHSYPAHSKPRLFFHIWSNTSQSLSVYGKSRPLWAGLAARVGGPGCARLPKWRRPSEA